MARPAFPGGHRRRVGLAYHRIEREIIEVFSSEELDSPEAERVLRSLQRRLLARLNQIKNEGENKS